MFVLVFGIHVRARPDELQHGVSIQISTILNLGKTFLRISCHAKKNCCDLNRMSRSSAFPDCGLYLWNGFDFLFRYVLNDLTLITSNGVYYPSNHFGNVGRFENSGIFNN